MSSTSKFGGVKRKQPSQAHGSSSRAQRNKLASKAVKKSKASFASSTTTTRRPSTSDADQDEGETELSGGLLFESDDDDDGNTRRGEDIRIRGRRGQTGDSDEEDGDAAADADEDGLPVDRYASETPDEKRVRLAREYLAKVEHDVDAEAEEGEEGGSEDELMIEEEKRGITRDAAIDKRLKQDLQQQRGTMKQIVAHQRYDTSSFPIEQAAGWEHHRPAHKKGGATCITLMDDNTHLFTGGKDCNIIDWDIETGKKVFTMFGNVAGRTPTNPGHTETVLSLSVSGDGNFLASGSKDGSIKIWDPRAAHSCVRTFHGAHKGAINGVVFRMGSHQLFSGGIDRTVKIWNIDQLAYIETLYGHTSDVTCLDALYKDRCLSVSRDKTARLWKVVEESQVMFRASPFVESLDCVSMLNEEQFITGGQDGSVTAWMVTKKKPTSIIPPSEAHGGKWINSVGAQRFTDVCFSGSSDGYLNLYCLESQGKMTNKLNRLHRIPVVGHINGIVSSTNGQFAALAVGTESRLGRWDKIPAARSGFHLISLAGIEQVKQIAEESKEQMDEENELSANGNGDHPMEEDEADEEEEEEEDDSKSRKRQPRPSSASAAAATPSTLPPPPSSTNTAFQDYPSNYGGGFTNGRGGGRGGARGGRGGSARGGSSRGGGRGGGARGGAGGRGRGR